MAKKRMRMRPIHPIPEAVRRWYQKIGAMGGRQGKGTELRKELMRQNAHKRWALHREIQAAEAKALKKIFSDRVPF